MFSFLFILGLALTPCAYAWNVPNLTHLVVFGDSWSDAGRLHYFLSHNGSVPPVGWIDNGDTPAADGGRPWPSYVGQYTGADVYNYAVAGAVCSNDLTPRIAQPVGKLFPDVAGYQVPAFLADSQYTYSNGTMFMDAAPESTVYAIMIGGNDVGADGFLTDSQTPGTTIADYIDCVFHQIDRLFQHGARNFVIHTLGAMYLTPQYGMPNEGGLKATQYWPDKYSNTTGVSQRMLEQVALVNAVYKARLPLEVEFQRRYPGAQFALVDLESLVSMIDIHKYPAGYLNGTSPYNVTGYTNHCSLSGTDCVRYDNENRDAFMWYDELHPSEQTWRAYARILVDIISGSSKWATYISA
ncbi:hypothetical protein ASPBRDRAFT_111870 [Aspergillus brasiliensis CBS 101740]|uniref:SGNH hydrolase-type esterase domain-containing protein n=1 Tax=Aspergillus brasiliensis (strain CBS 101740 / IMI 381727 / IBT 21946) TaxID=767769 RepID=A0A1L9V1B0_ASPBC|nr:hypothetical protein ASPBRDRAFT_111870 [Aspergillus brasiliensis CBS 101740]